MVIRFDKNLHNRHIEKPIINTHLGYNILMFGFDSVSRMAFMRLLPKTYSYLINELGSIVMKGYNIVGDSTTPNLLALLTGHKIEELYEARKGKDNFTSEMIFWIRQIETEYIHDELLLFLKNLNKNDILNHTILIIMTDHGPRFSYTAKTYQGRLEERLPFMSIRMPIEFQKTYPNIMNNLRLTTPFDVHETFLHMFNFHSLKSYQTKSTRSISLFNSISNTRTCTDAGISSHLCACLNCQSVIKYFNQFMSTYENNSECAVLSLYKVIKARLLIENKVWLKFDEMANGQKFNQTNIKTYQIQFETIPGHGQFELTAIYHLDNMTFDIQRQHLSRINTYGQTSACIAEKRPEFREICYCSYLLKTKTKSKDY